jgi:hypothetical protein
MQEGAPVYGVPKLLSTSYHLSWYVNQTESESRPAAGVTAVFSMNVPEKRCA